MTLSHRTRTAYGRLVGSRTKQAVIFPAAFLQATAAGTFSLSMIFFARERFGASPATVGALSSTWALCYVTSCLGLRRLSRVMVPRYSTLAAAVSMFLAGAAVSRADSLPVAFVSYGLYGLAASFFWPPMMGWLSAGLEGGELNRTMGRFNLCWSSGIIVGPALAGILCERNPVLGLRVGLALVLCVAAVILAGVVVLPRLRDDDAAHENEKRTPASGDRGTPIRYAAWGVVFAIYVVMGVTGNVFPLYGTEVLGFSKTVIGFLLLVRAAATTGMLLTMARFTVWHFRAGQLAAGPAVCACFLLAARGIHGVAGWGVVFAVFGLALGHGYANSLFHGVTGSIRRGARMAVHEALLSGGMVVGATSGGLLYQNAGIAAVLGASAAVLIVAAGASAVFAIRLGRGDASALRDGARPAP